MDPAPRLNRNASHGLRLGLLVGALLFVAHQTSLDADATSPEYQAKANLLCSFAKFVDWPQDAFLDEKSSLVIGVFRSNPFGSRLTGAAQGKHIRGRPLEVRLVRTAAEATAAHILFVSASQERASRDCLRELGGRAILTVGETPSFAAAGGIITLARDSDTLVFDVNLNALERTALHISAQMLKVARTTVRPTP